MVYFVVTTYFDEEKNKEDYFEEMYLNSPEIRLDSLFKEK